MPLYIKKQPITIIGMGMPILIRNLHAHRIVDEDTSRIILLSTIGAELNTAQHFGHNSRKITIRGRINLTTVEGSLFQLNPFAGSAGINSVEAILTGLKFLKETKSAILLIMNHSVCYGVIDKIIITDDREYPTSLDYECHIIEKDLFGLRFSAISQRILSGLLGTFASANPFFEKTRLTPSETVIPKFTSFETEGS